MPSDSENVLDAVYVEELDSTSIGARKLGDLIKQFGGIVGTLKHPETGKEVRASLEPWADRDRETTFIRVSFRGSNPESVRRGHAPNIPGGRPRP